MNIRIADQSLRFKITSAELAELLAGDSKQTKVNFSNGGAMTFNLIPWHKPLALTYKPSGVQLMVPMTALEGLQAKGRSKEGSVFMLDNQLKLSIEVDVRSPRGDGVAK